MYQPRTSGFTKRDPVKRWSVPDRLWLAEPRHFLYDPLPRARSYLDRFPAPDRIALS